MSPRKRTPEGMVKDSIKDTAALIPGLRLWSVLGGLGQAPGIADYIGVYKGRAVAVEAKAPKGRQSDHQKEFERAWTECGGCYILARSGKDLAVGLGVKTLLWDEV